MNEVGEIGEFLASWLDVPIDELESMCPACLSQQVDHIVGHLLDDVQDLLAAKNAWLARPEDDSEHTGLRPDAPLLTLVRPAVDELTDTERPVEESPPESTPPSG
jgi:hypothetical protein